MNRFPFALALLLACVCAMAAPPSDADLAAAKAKLAEGQAAAERGDEATAMGLVGEAARLAQSGEIAHKLGHFYEGKTELPGHEAEALKWFLYAVDLRQADAMHHVGKRYLEGSGGLQRDVGKGLELMQASADAGYEPAYGVAHRFREEQDGKARCLLAALRGYDMREVVFGAHRFYQINAGQGSDTSGDTYEVEGFSNGFGSTLASLSVDGFDGVHINEVEGRELYTDLYTSRPASADALRLAARLREKCGVSE